MTRTTFGVSFLLAPILFTLTGALASSATAGPAKTKKPTCEAAAKTYPSFTSSKCTPTGVESDSQKAGGLYISVFDENERPLPGFCVRINGRIMGRTQEPAFSLDAGDKVIEVQHADVGHACREASLKAGEIAKIGFQFFPLREEVTQLSTTVMERQYYGAIAVKNAFGGHTEVFVDPSRKWEKMEDWEFDDRVSKGRGSLKVSNLAPDDYVVEVREKRPPRGITTVYRNKVTLSKCKTVIVDARAGRPKPRAVPTPCETAKTSATASTRAKPRKKPRATHARRDIWHARWRD